MPFVRRTYVISRQWPKLIIVTTKAGYFMEHRLDKGHRLTSIFLECKLARIKLNIYRLNNLLWNSYEMFLPWVYSLNSFFQFALNFLTCNRKQSGVIFTSIKLMTFFIYIFEKYIFLNCIHLTRNAIKRGKIGFLNVI